MRAWVAERCDPYVDVIYRKSPQSLVEETSKVYIKAFEAITGQAFQPDDSGESPWARIRSNLLPISLKKGRTHGSRDTTTDRRALPCNGCRQRDATPRARRRKPAKIS